MLKRLISYKYVNKLKIASESKLSNVVKNDTSYLVKKADYNTKTEETEKKIPTTEEFNKLMEENFAERLKMTMLIL